MFITFLLSQITPVSFSATKTQEWLAYTLPPYFMPKENKFFAQGIGDAMLDEWKKLTPNFVHKSVLVSIPRLKSFVVSPDNNYCVVGSFISEKDKEFYVWSDPVFYEPPPMIIMSKESFEQLESPEVFSAKGLASIKKFKFGHVKGRYYSGELDKTIASMKKSKKLVEISNKIPALSLSKMILAKRVQWGILFHTELEWLFKNKMLKATPADLVLVPIKGHDVSLSVHAGCAKTKQGKDIVSKIQAA